MSVWGLVFALVLLVLFLSILGGLVLFGFGDFEALLCSPGWPGSIHAEMTDEPTVHSQGLLKNVAFPIAACNRLVAAMCWGFVIAEKLQNQHLCNFD